MCVAVKWDAFTSQVTLKTAALQMRVHYGCAMVESWELEACAMGIAADEERVGAGS